MPDYAKVELEGVVVRDADENVHGDWYVEMVVLPLSPTLRVKVIGKGSTLHGFTVGDRLYVKGALRWPGGNLVVWAARLRTPLPKPSP